MEDLEVILSKKIIFCFPYRGAGGVCLLFLRLATYLHHQGFNVALIDYVDGYMAENNTENIPLIEYRGDVLIEQDSIVIFQAMTPWSIFSKLHMNSDSQIFFLATLPQNFYPLLPVLRNSQSKGGMFVKLLWRTILLDEYKKVCHFLKLTIEKKAMAFLDYDIVKNIEQSLRVKVNEPNIIPLFSEDVDENLYVNKSVKNKTRVDIGWVGRIADFKVHILNKVLRDAANYAEAEQTMIHFTIVGSGEWESKLEVSENPYFKVHCIPHIPPVELADFLLGLDIYFAMGTSALDGARLGVPTVRLDYSFSQVSDGYRYKFLHEVKGYSLGELIHGAGYNKGSHSFEGLMKAIHTEKCNLSELIFNFYVAHHSISQAAHLLIQSLESSTLKWSDLLARQLTFSRLYLIWKKVRF